MKMMTANAGTSMCKNSFTYWATWTDVETGLNKHLSRYISKSALWEDMKNLGATREQILAAKEGMKKAPTKKMYQ